MADTSARISEVVIPAAGLGTRMREITGGKPKELLLLGGKPLIQYTIEEAYRAGIRKFVVIIRKDKDVLRQHLEKGEGVQGVCEDGLMSLEEVRRRSSFHFCYQEEPTGEADAIALARDYIEGEALGIIYPDNLAFPTGKLMQGLVETYEYLGEDVLGLVTVSPETAKGMGDSGHLDLEPLGDDLYRIKRFLPKNRGPFRLRFPGELRSTGFSVSRREIFSVIEKLKGRRGEGEFIDIHFREEILRERPLYGWLFRGRVFDAGNPEGYRQCRKFLDSGVEAISD